MKKGFTLIELLIIIAVLAVLGVLSAFVFASLANKAEACGFWSPCDDTSSNELKASAETQKNLVKSVPVPQITNSLERANVAKRAALFDSPDKISYIYLVNYGKVMAFYTVRGKVSSLRSYMTPEEKLVDAEGNTCTHDSSESFCYIIGAADIDGTYGENVDGIFFFTTEGAYVEWHGDYMMSDQPLKLTTQPELIREIK